MDIKENVQAIKEQIKKNDCCRKYLLNPRMKLKMKSETYPTRLILEPTNKCNFLCHKCLYPEMKRSKMEMQLDNYKDFLIAWKKEFGAFKVIEFTGAGEVLINKSFVDMIKIATEIMPNTKLMTTTNLALLTPELTTELLDSGLRTWQVSLDSIDPIEFREITKTGNLDKVLANLEMLWRLMKDRGINNFELVIVAHRPLDESFVNKMEEITKRVSPFSHRILKLPYQSLNSRKNEPEFKLSENIKYNKHRMVCSYLWTDLVVLSDGTVRMCCSDMFDSPVDFGNIFKDTPSEIVTNSARKKYQNKVLDNRWNELYLCDVCHSPQS